MNFGGRTLPKWLRIKKVLEADLEDVERFDKESGADLRLALILLERAINGLETAVNLKRILNRRKPLRRLRRS